ncbi:MAG: enoyl-CoA hydratase-related protein [Pseudomonadota bacterium]
MELDNIRVSVSGNIGYLKIDRPAVKNALDQATLNQLALGLAQLAEDKQVKVIVLTGEDNSCFSAGADIEALAKMTIAQVEEFISQGHRCFTEIEVVSKPVIAAISGYALGGGFELALACDFIYATQSAKFGLPEVNLGIFPGFGGTQRLPRLIGAARAKELIFSGRIIDANQALDLGIVNKVVPEAELLEQVKKLAKEISANSQIAIGLAKHAINAGDTKKIEEGLNIERDDFYKCFQTKDPEKGFKAFLNKTKPEF